MSFHVIRNDITKVKADAIVNTANPAATYGCGVDSAIYHAAGVDELLAEREKIGPIARGEVAVTPAFKLKAKYIIHTVGPVWFDGTHDEEAVLTRCYEKSIKAAEELGCASIAFPLISTGVYGFPKDKGLQIAFNALQSYAMHHTMEIFLVIYDTEAYEISLQVFKDIENYIEANYEPEYERPGRWRRRGRRAEAPAFRAESISSIRDNAFEARPMMKPSMSSFESAEKASAKPVIPELEDAQTFQEKFFEYLDKTGLSDPEFYKKLNLSKQMFSKVRSNANYQPTKNTAIIFCLGLELDLEQATDLLARAGFALSPSNRLDLFVKSCFIYKMYDLNWIDLYLAKEGYPMLLKY